MANHNDNNIPYDLNRGLGVTTQTNPIAERHDAQ